MEITWFGHSCFRVRSREAIILLDPPGPEWGSLGRLQADIVTVSHPHAGHNNVAAVGGNPYIINGPGEYELKDVLILGIGTHHDAAKGEQRGKNTVFILELEDLTVCHLGDLGHVPSTSQVEDVGEVDVLLIPVGGVTTLNAARAVETINLIEPRIVIPMHYWDEKRRADLDPLDRFLKEVGISEAQPQQRLNVTRNSLPQDRQVVVLEGRLP
ncbi:MAG: MBL fold metallo-hydrolase [Chloroflexi bacterium]|nr:MBL fold metallo-hydrolase [Chloroflexota bacterium]